MTSEVKQEAKKVVVIGAGVAGLSAAANLAFKGYNVTVIERFEEAGGRNRIFRTKCNDGIEGRPVREYAFEIGPSWLWMPQVHEEFYARLDRNMKDYLILKKLEPAYKIVFEDCTVEVPNGQENFEKLLCSVVDNDVSDKKIAEDMKKVVSTDFNNMYEKDKMRYELSMTHFLDKPSLSPTDFVGSMSWSSRLALFKTIPQIGLYQSQHKRISNMFQPFNKSENKEVQKAIKKIIRILEWPVIFVGGSPEMIPEVYGLLLYSAIEHGTLVPENGMYDIVRGMYKVCLELGVNFQFGQDVIGINFDKKEQNINKVSAHVRSGDDKYNIKQYVCDEVVTTSDMAHFERTILPTSKQMYKPEYWDRALVSPSCLLFFVGLKTKFKSQEHHVLFFDGPLFKQMDLIYPAANEIKAPNTIRDFKKLGNPLFYLNIASKTHNSYAPSTSESVFILIPMPHNKVSDKLEDWLFKSVMKRVESRLGIVHNMGKKDATIFNYIDTKTTYKYQNFIDDYNSLKGNAFGVSNSLLQTAFMRPRMQSLYVENLTYAGQSTVPGGGIPPCILSGYVASNILVAKDTVVERGYINSVANYFVSKVERFSSVATVWVMQQVNPYFKF